MSNAPSLSRITALATTLVAIALGCVLSPRAAAQLVPVEPYYVTTTRGDVPLKSGEMDGYYDVARLPAGQVLWVDAEGEGWARVAYPQGVPVYVPAEHVEPAGEEGFVRLTRESTLKSRNTAAGFAQSWQRAIPRGLEGQLPIGSRLRVREEVRSAAGAAIGYLVDAPAPVRGYVRASALRAATRDEVSTYLASVPEAARPAEPEARPVDVATETPPATRPGTGASDLTEAQVPVGEEPAEPVAADPVEVAAQPETTIDLTTDPAQPEDAAPVVIAQGDMSPSERRIGTLMDLAEAFDRVQRQPSDTAELDELAAEFRRAISAQGDDEPSRRIRASLEDRLALVNLRIELRDKRRELRARREEIDSSAQAVASRVSELERTRGYAFVGRLVESSVYNGERLPLMYRVVSISGLVPRTIGYIRPQQGGSVAVSDKLGEIVGILGDAQFDEALQLRIVNPSRVDVLSAATAFQPID